MNQSDSIRIKHMIDAAEEALAFTEDVEFENFSKNRMLILSVIKDIEIINKDLKIFANNYYKFITQPLLSKVFKQEF